MKRETSALQTHPGRSLCVLLGGLEEPLGGKRRDEGRPQLPGELPKDRGEGHILEFGFGWISWGREGGRGAYVAEGEGGGRGEVHGGRDGGWGGGEKAKVEKNCRPLTDSW